MAASGSLRNTVPYSKTPRNPSLRSTRRIGFATSSMSHSSSSWRPPPVVRKYGSMQYFLLVLRVENMSRGAPEHCPQIA